MKFINNLSLNKAVIFFFIFILIILAVISVIL